VAVKHKTIRLYHCTKWVLVYSDFIVFDDQDFQILSWRLVSAVTMPFHSYEVGEAVTYVQAASLCVMAKGHCGCPRQLW